MKFSISQSGRTTYFLVSLLLVTIHASSAGDAWERIAGKQTDDWFHTEDGVRTTEQVIQYQYPSGGWPKNIDMAKPTSSEAIHNLIAGDDEATIDNGTTYSQIHFLAKAYSCTQNPLAREGALKGLEYLLDSQYPTGGWPVFYPRTDSYYGMIHYNDNSVVGVLQLFKDIGDGYPEFEWLPQDVTSRVVSALERGIQCILNSQVSVDGRLTVWCAQHDPVTLKPAAARNFEPVSLSGMESAYLVLFLMSLPDPSPRIAKAIEAATIWFNDTAIPDVEIQNGLNQKGEHDRMLVLAKGKGPLWARFYEIGSDRPIFAGRDKIIHYDYDQIELERRTGYAYFSSAPQKVLDAYPGWKASIAE